MSNQRFWIATKFISLFLGVLLVLAKIVCNLHKPNPSAHKDVQVLREWLHIRYSLDRRGTRPNDRNTIIGPLLLLIVLWPDGSVNYTALERIDSFDRWPFEVVEDASSVEKKITLFLKLPRLSIRCRLPQRDFPFTRVILPLSANRFSIERHVLAQIEDFDDLGEVLLNVWGVGEEAGPIGIEGKVERVCV